MCTTQLKNMFVVTFLLFLSVGFSLVEADEPQWHLMHQNDYDVKPHRIEVLWYNRSYFHNLEFGFVLYNRTFRVLNGSFNLLQDVTDKFMFHTQMFKFMSNEYRFFPVTFNLEMCKEYNLNSFGAKDIFTQASNIRSCPMKKGFYYLKNASPDYSKWPPLLPRGDYKFEFKFYDKSYFLWELHVYVAIVDKPAQWNN